MAQPCEPYKYAVKWFKAMTVHSLRHVPSAWGVSLSVVKTAVGGIIHMGPFAIDLINDMHLAIGLYVYNINIWGLAILSRS